MTQNDSMPLGALTIGEFRELMVSILASSRAKEARPHGNLVYGLRGIERLFGVSHKTAQEYKDTFLAPAVMQNGRKIVVDADMALELFRMRQDNGKRECSRKA